MNEENCPYTRTHFLLATKEDMFIKIFWRFYRFNHEEFSNECLYILDKTPPNFMGVYFL